MAFLIKKDYFAAIRENQLDVILKQAGQITAMSPEQVRQEAEKRVIAKISSTICHRYDASLIFTEVLTWNESTQFNINDLVQYSEASYSEASTYAVNDLVSFKTTANDVLSDDIYKCITAVTSPESFVAAKWTKQIANNLLYVTRQPSIAIKPGTDFIYDTNLFTGNHSTIKGWDKTKDLFFERVAEVVTIYYSAADRLSKSNSIGRITIGEQVKIFPTVLPIEAGTDTENTLSGNLTVIGFMPDAQQWGATATNPFEPEDNRHSIIIDIMVDLVLFRLHGLINPRMIPDFIGENRDNAMEWLNDIKKGDITPKLPLFSDEARGQQVVFGSEKKLNHNFFSC
jgi:hypothetical protein